MISILKLLFQNKYIQVLSNDGKMQYVHYVHYFQNEFKHTSSRHMLSMIHHTLLHMLAGNIGGSVYFTSPGL